MIGAIGNVGSVLLIYLDTTGNDVRVLTHDQSKGLQGRHLGGDMDGWLSQVACTHLHETLLWVSKSRHARPTFSYDLINSPIPSSQVSIWGIPTVPRCEKPHGHHSAQKPLRLVRRALLPSTHEGDLVFDPFTGSGTTTVAAKELNRAFVGAELEEEFGQLAVPRILTTKRRSLLCEISEQFWSNA